MSTTHPIQWLHLGASMVEGALIDHCIYHELTESPSKFDDGGLVLVSQFRDGTNLSGGM